MASSSRATAGKTACAIATAISPTRVRPPTATAERAARAFPPGRARRACIALTAQLALAAATAPAFADGLTLEGVDGALRENVLAYLSLDEQPCDAPEWQMRRRLRDSDARVREALQALGYYEPVIERRIEFGETCWSATISIAPGPRAAYARFDVTISGDGADDPTLDAVARARPQPGDPLHHGRYEAFKARLGRALAERGYAEWRFERARLEVDAAAGTASAELAVATGPRYRFGEIRIEQTAFDPGLVSRFVDIRPGEWFDRARLTRLQRDMGSSALFDRVVVAGDYDAMADGRIPVVIRLEAGEKLGYFFGVGASTDRGPRVTGGYRNRRVNRRGHQFNANVQVSPVLSRFDARYRLPLADPRREWQSYQLRLEDENTDTSDSQTVELGVERIRSLRRDWVLTYGVQIGRTDFTVANVTDTTTLTMPVAGLTRRRADSDANPRSGESIELRLRLASSALASSTDFVQLYTRYRRLFAVGDKGRLSLRGEVGATWRNDFDELPPQVRFFAGGDASVRGYDYESLGPVDADGNVTGGANLLTASVEYEHTVRGNWGLAVFADTGNAFFGRDVNERTGVGLGIIWRSPVGPLRAYLAHPLDDDRSVRLHVTFGADL